VRISKEMKRGEKEHFSPRGLYFSALGEILRRDRQRREGWGKRKPRGGHLLAFFAGTTASY